MKYGIAMSASPSPANSAPPVRIPPLRHRPSFELRRDDALAVVTELAAGLRLYSRGGVQLTESYDDDQIPPGATGITLAPWANRVEDGVWYLEGKKQQLDITEASRNNASHGLLRNSGYTLVDESEFRDARGQGLPAARLPFPGPALGRYELDEALDLRVWQTLINDSQEAAPFVLGRASLPAPGRCRPRGPGPDRARPHPAGGRRAAYSPQHRCRRWPGRLSAGTR